MRRLPGTLARGRVRTSTVLLTVAFFAVLSLWVSVRPSTEEVVVRHTRATTTQDTELPRREPAPAATRRPTPTPTPTPLATAQNGKASSAPGTAPAPLPVAPPPDPTPGQSSAPAGSLSQIVAPGHATPAPTPPSDTAPPTYP